jgi:hypothetical protein
MVESNPAHDQLVAVGLVVASAQQDGASLECGTAHVDVSVNVGCLLLCDPSACNEVVPIGLRLEGPLQRASEDDTATFSCCLRWDMPGNIISLL